MKNRGNEEVNLLQFSDCSVQKYFRVDKKAPPPSKVTFVLAQINPFRTHEKIHDDERDCATDDTKAVSAVIKRYAAVTHINDAKNCNVVLHNGMLLSCIFYYKKDYTTVSGKYIGVRNAYTIKLTRINRLKRNAQTGEQNLQDYLWKNTTKSYIIKGYLMKLLFNASSTMASFYWAEVIMTYRCLLQFVCKIL
ncbi:MAG: hypothetical protein K0S76_3083 [Herbinix sp.]|nr:hypothetical protein [Herbinix sp.]